MNAGHLGAIYPLTPMQKGMLFHTLSEPASAVYVEQLTCALVGELDADAFERAWQRVVERHEVLRTAFVWEGLDEPMQVVQDSVTMPVERQDWRTLAPAARADRLEALLSADRRRGFRLAEAPLSRLTLIRVGEQETWLVWTHHHLLLDGWSTPIVLSEVFDGYAALREGGEPELAPPRPYREYVAWIRKQDGARAEAFWRRTLAGFRERTPLPWLDVRPDRNGPLASSAFEEQALDFGPERTEAIRAFARRHRLTINTLFQGAWALFLAKTSGEREVVFGTTVSGRPLEIPGVETMVGLFINTLPLRARVAPEARLVPWLAALQESQAAARDHEWSPLPDVQGWSEVARGSALFDSLLVFENYPIDQSLRGLHAGIQLRDIRSIERTNYPLTLAIEPGARLVVLLSAMRSRFLPESVAAILACLRTLVDAMLASPEARLGELALLAPDEARRLVARAHGPESHADDGRCIHDLVRAQASRTPEAVALVAGTRTMTYAELRGRTRRLAARLRALGVRPETVVGVCFERSLDGIVAILATLEAGGAYLPLDPALPRERLAFLVRDAGAELVLTCDRHRTGFAAAVRVVSVEEPADDAAPERPEPDAPGVVPSNLAYVLYTSGSTGTPKGVMVSHRNVCHRLAWGQAALPLDASDAVLQKSSWSFDVSVLEIFAPLVAGARLVLAEPGGEIDPAYLVRTIASQRITMVDFVPTFLSVLLEEPGVGALSSLRRVTCGGEALPAEVAARFAARLPATLHNFYGPTETTIDATTWTCERAHAGPPPIGKPVGDARVYLLDERLEPVPDGLPGEIVVGGPGVARGYLGRPERTAEAFVPDPFGGTAGARLYRTGDLGRRFPDGNIEFLGRRDGQVKLRGFRIELGELEAALAAHESVREAAAALREDVPGDRRLAAYVVAKGKQAPAAAELRLFLRARLPEHMLPATFTRLDALPRSPSGKLDRRALPRPEREERGAAFVAPRSENEAKLAEIWAAVLRVERVSVDDGFFELGGDSILAIQIVSKAREAGLALTPRHLFEHPTIAALASVSGTVEAALAEQGPVTGGAPLTPIQHWFFEQEFAEAHHWNQAVMLALPRALEPVTIERALGHLVAHHDALRLRFAREPGGWTQTHAGLEVAVPFERHDLTRLPEHERPLAMAEAAAAVQRSFDLARGPLFRAAWFDLGGERTRLLLAAHHLVVDAVSWRILLEDLWSACLALGRGEPVELAPKTTSFAEWSERLREHARSAAIERELPYWLAARASVAPLPVDHPGGANELRAARTVVASLEAAETRALLQDARAAYRTEINDLLLAALAEAFSKWTGARRLLVELEGHGREDLLQEPGAAATLDLSRTVGWFTAVFPVLLDLSAARGPGEAIRTTKESLRAIPRRGLGYGLLRWMRGDAALARRLREPPAAEVSFNYLGQIDASLPPGAGFAWARESSGPCHSPAGRRTHLLDVDASVSDGRLHVEWTYCESIHERATIESLAAHYLDALRTLVAHCLEPGAGAYTPSDFPDADLDQAELDKILATVSQAKKGARR